MGTLRLVTGRPGMAVCCSGSTTPIASSPS
ncbi:Uncharacterised protein [Mycobacteroides abscessus subsp. abscessus]|nr:Uncharacterised protein [Mycobacteroides abscessus subsp. abscessus]